MLFVFAAAFSISSILISYGMREDADQLLIIKLIGLYLLSAVTISFNTSFPIPVGFLGAYLFALKAHSNKKSKRICTLAGLLATILCTLLYLIH